MKYKPLGLSGFGEKVDKPYSPFERVASDPISKADAAYLRGQSELPKHTQDENKLRAILEIPIAGNVWEVACPAVGTFAVVRYKDQDEKTARATFKEYSIKSLAGYGECGHEVVSLTYDGTVIESYVWTKEI